MDTETNFDPSPSSSDSIFVYCFYEMEIENRTLRIEVAMRDFLKSCLGKLFRVATFDKNSQKFSQKTLDKLTSI